MGKNINVKEKNIDFLAMWKAYWNPTAEEVTQEEEILANAKITEDEKKELLKALDSNAKLSNKLFRNSYKTAKLEVTDLKQSAKKAINEKNSDKISTKTENNTEISKEQNSQEMEIGD